MVEKYAKSIIFKTDALVSQLIQRKENFKSQDGTGKISSLKSIVFLHISEGDMLKYLLWLKLIKYGKIDTKGGNGMKRNPMRLLYTLHPEDCVSRHIS